jgi:hypothetical protein
MAMMLAHALLLVLAFAPSAALAARDGWQNITVYRVTPIEDGGVLNMNTADPAGDVYFGLSQLLLPYMCGGETHVSLWCNNRKWLSGGNAWMVYRKFTIEARECEPFVLLSARVLLLSQSPCLTDGLRAAWLAASWLLQAVWTVLALQPRPIDRHLQLRPLWRRQQQLAQGLRPVPRAPQPLPRWNAAGQSDRPARERQRRRVLRELL